MESFTNKGTNNEVTSIIARMRELRLEDDVIQGWLLSQSAHLDGRIPHEVLEEGDEDDIREVKAALEAYLDGVPASEYKLIRDRSGAKIIPFPKRPD